MALGVANIPPRDWDMAVVKGCLVPSDGSSFECQARWFAYLSAIDRGDGTRAGEHLDRMMSLMTTLPRSVAPLIFAEAAYYEGWWRGRADDSAAGYSGCRCPLRSCLITIDCEQKPRLRRLWARQQEPGNWRTTPSEWCQAMPSGCGNVSPKCGRTCKNRHDPDRSH